MPGPSSRLNRATAQLPSGSWPIQRSGSRLEGSYSNPWLLLKTGLPTSPAFRRASTSWFWKTWALSADRVDMVGDGDRCSGHGEEIDRALALAVVGEGLHDQRVAVEDHLAPTGDVGETGEPQERVVPLGPFGLPGLAALTQVVPGAVADVVVDPDQVAVLTFS